MGRKKTEEMKKLEGKDLTHGEKFNIPKHLAKRYVISTKIYDSLEEAEEQIKKWQDDFDLTRGTKVFEINENIYEPKFKLVKLQSK